MTDEDESQPHGLSDSQQRQALAERERAEAMLPEAHRLRGAYLDSAASIEGILAQVLTMHFLRVPSEERDPEQLVLRQWHRRILSILSFDQKLEAVRLICGDGLETESYAKSGFTELLGGVKAHMQKRNKIAHSALIVDYVFGEDPSDEDWVRGRLVATEMARGRAPSLKAIDLGQLREDVAEITELRDRLGDAFVEAIVNRQWQ